VLFTAPAEEVTAAAQERMQRVRAVAGAGSAVLRWRWRHRAQPIPHPPQSGVSGGL